MLSQHMYVVLYSVGGMAGCERSLLECVLLLKLTAWTCKLVLSKL